MVRRKDNKGKVLEKGEVQRKDGKYAFQYQDLNGTRRYIYSNNLSDLRKREKQIKIDLEDRIDTLGAEISLNEQFEKYISLKTKLANSTRQNYIDLWNNNVKDSFLGKKKISEIRKSDILRFYSSLNQKGFKYSTIKAFDCMIAPSLELAVDDDVIRKNPCKGCLANFKNDDAREKNSLSLQEQEELMDFLKNSPVYSVYLPMIAFMLGTGARCGETIGLTWRDVDFDRKEVKIDHQLIYKKIKGEYRFYANTPKTASGIRTIPMTREVYNSLKKQREQQFANGWKTQTEIDGYSDFVFSTKHKNPIMPSAVNSLLYNIVNRHNSQKNVACLLPHMSAHILRHTACTRMAEAGIDIKVLQYIMGHSSIAVTMEVYNHISTERNRKEIDKLEKVGF